MMNAGGSSHSQPPPGLIGVTQGFLGRYNEFQDSLDHLLIPPGSKKMRRTGVNIAKNFNDMCRGILHDKSMEWLWILGDDHVFMPDLLIQLIMRNVDVVVPLCLARRTPCQPVVFERSYNFYAPVPLSWLDGQHGLVDISNDKNVGNAGMLINRRIIEQMEDPWFECGMTNREVGGYDLWFCEKLHKSGTKIYLDLDNTIGHITHAVVWPKKDIINGTWGGEVRLPQ